MPRPRHMIPNWLRLVLQVEHTDSGCWDWQGRSLNRDGRGKVELDGRSLHASRAVYMAFVGPIPDGLELDHLCRRPTCVNPAHLEPVTRLENIRRRYVDYDTCFAGHPYNAANTYRRPNGRRDCRACIRNRSAAYAARRRAAA